MQKLIAASSIVFVALSITGCAKPQPAYVLRFTEPASAENKWEYETDHVKVNLGLIDCVPIRNESAGQGPTDGYKSTVLVAFTNKRPVAAYLDCRKTYSYNLAADATPNAHELISKDLVMPPGYPTGITKELSTVGHLMNLQSDKPETRQFYFWWGGAPGVNATRDLSMPQWFNMRVVWDDGQSEDVKFAIMMGPESRIGEYIVGRDKARQSPTTQSVAQAN